MSNKFAFRSTVNRAEKLQRAATSLVSSPSLRVGADVITYADKRIKELEAELAALKSK